MQKINFKFALFKGCPWKCHPWSKTCQEVDCYRQEGLVCTQETNYMTYRHDVMVVDDTQLFLVSNSILLTKFGLSEKRTKFGKNLPHGFDKSADLLNKS